MVNGEWKSRRALAARQNIHSPFTIYRAPLQVLQESLRVVEEISGERDVLDLVVGQAAQGRVVEAEDVCAGQGHEDGRVRGDDELRVLRGHLFEHGEQRELSLRRERGLRLVQKIKSAGHKPRLEEVKEALAVRARVCVLAVAARKLAALTAHGPLRELQPVALQTLALELAGHLLKLRAQLVDALREVEEVLRAQEEAFVRPLRPGQTKLRGQLARVRQSLVAPHVLAADDDRADAPRDGFEHRRLPRPVLSDEERHGRAQLDLAEFFDDGQREGESVAPLRRGVEAD